jgi:AbrB family looped-hinge helix DNA binding protein
MKSTAHVVKPMRRGQITLPQEFRRRLGIGDDTLLEIRLAGDHVEIRPVVARPAAGSEWARELYELFAPVRQEASAEGMTEEEIDREIEAAIRETRAARRDA